MTSEKLLATLLSQQCIMNNCAQLCVVTLARSTESKLSIFLCTAFQNRMDNIKREDVTFFLNKELAGILCVK